MSNVLITNENSICFLTLNRPEKRNALNDELIEELKNALREADSDDNLRAIVIRGAGSDFCSGADLAALQKIAESSVQENLADAKRLMDLFLLMRKVKIPVIAAVHGRALAGGCGLATACDIVLATNFATFGYPEVKIGFVPAMVTAILRRNLSEKKSFELITQGFDFSAGEALEMGLINRVFDEATFDTDVNEYVSVYTRVSRSAVTLSKKLMYKIDGMDFDSSMEMGAEINTIARQTEDCKKGIAKFLNK
jgi:methylglutaconyl-CoA hydratase